MNYLLRLVGWDGQVMYTASNDDNGVPLFIPKII